MEEVLVSLEERVTGAMNKELLRPYTPEEIVHALKQMHPLKSPGPDGMSHIFFQKYWDIVEAFSTMFRQAEEEGQIQGVAVSRHTPRVSHLLFADDTLVFCQATTEAFNCVYHIFNKFKCASGLKINLQKSAVVFSKNVENASQIALASILGISVDVKHEKYLGLPTINGRSKREVFNGIKERIWKKLNCWSSKQLSQAGRSVLIKFVLLMVPAYAISCFRLPDTLLREIESMIADSFGAAA
ncbi:UNVERIFIED_CONTAM: hypothetical protein Slati_3136100 [Sesamum latifolium]|uniref:Reverse transcriptase domain-containing protein n=1 Tax=Sesamum latifolium TaxID=2727402 RepID=A0AAW2UWD1_9LAMI